jgi:hypothetical protein
MSNKYQNLNAKALSAFAVAFYLIARPAMGQEPLKPAYTCEALPDGGIEFRGVAPGTEKLDLGPINLTARARPINGKDGPMDLMSFRLVQKEYTHDPDKPDNPDAKTVSTLDISLSDLHKMTGLERTSNANIVWGADAERKGTENPMDPRLMTAVKFIATAVETGCNLPIGTIRGAQIRFTGRLQF